MKSSSTNYKMNYNVILLDNNNDENTNYFTNEQIKFALIKNGTYVANTSENSGIKLSTIPGFTEGESHGYGYVLQEQEIVSGTTDNYKLRIWISDDVNYSDEIDEDGTMTGKFNSYKYSLKVKVTSGLGNTTSFDNIETAGPTIIAELSDPNGLSAYAVTTSNTAPGNDSNEWIEITDTTAKSKVMRLASNLITNKKITHTVDESGTYYLHVKNKIDQVTTKEVKVTIDRYTINFDGNGGTASSESKEVINKTTYGELPSATRTGYIFDGWYTSSTEGEKVTSTSNVDINDNQTLYARWISKTFANKVAVLTEFTGTTSETIMCESSESGDFYNCDEMTLVETGTEARDGTIFLLKDIEYNDKIRFNTSNTKKIDMNSYNINFTNESILLSKGILTITDETSSSKISSQKIHPISIGYDSKLNVENVNISHEGETSYAAIWVSSTCDNCSVSLNKVNITSTDAGIYFISTSKNSVMEIKDSTIISQNMAIVNNGTNNTITINGGKYESIANSILVNKNNNKTTILNAYLKSNNSHATIDILSGNVEINGDYPTFDNDGNYISGTYIYSNRSNGATIHVENGTLKVNGGYIYHDAAEDGTWRQHALRLEAGTAYLNGGTFESLGNLNTDNNAKVVYLNQNNATINVNGATIKGGLYVNYSESTSNPLTYAYICKGNIDKLTVHNGSTAYIKSSGITWGTQPTFGEYIIQDDTITCSE